MESLKEQWSQLEARVDILSARERVYLLLAVCAVGYGLWDFALHTPAVKQGTELRRTLTEAQTAITAAEQQSRAILERQRVDPNAEIRQRLQGLDQQMVGLESKKREIAISFLSPRAMSGLLQSLLKRQGGLNLISLESLPPQPLVDLGSTSKSPERGGRTLPMIYRHDLVVEFEGTYFDMVHYLKELEEQPIFWDSTDYEVKDYPQARVRLRVYTLSFSQELLGV